MPLLAMTISYRDVPLADLERAAPPPAWTPWSPASPRSRARSAPPIRRPPRSGRSALTSTGSSAGRSRPASARARRPGSPGRGTRSPAPGSAPRAPEPLIGPPAFARIIPGRGGRPLAVVDLGLPRNIHPDTAELDRGQDGVEPVDP